MLKEFKPNIVSICTPTPTHVEITKLVASCPSVKTIFLEKPIAQSLKEADEILHACKEYNIRLAINYSRRWSNVYQNLKHRISLPLYMLGVHPGPILRSGSHMVDLYNWYVTSSPYWEKTKVQAYGTPRLSAYMNETGDFNINGQIDYTSASATIIGNFLIPQKTVVFEFDAFYKNQRSKITENGIREETFECRTSHHYRELNEYSQTCLLEHSSKNLLFTAINDIVKSNNSIKCTGMDGRRALQVTLALHYSATHGNMPLYLKDLPYDYSVRSY